MATLASRIFFPAVVLLSTVFLVAAAAGAGGEVKKVCAKTPYPELCESSIAAYPESKTAENAEELVYWAINSASDMAHAGSIATNGSTDPCVAACHKNFVWASMDLSLAESEYPDYDAMIKDLRNLQDGAKKKKVEWNCEKCLGSIKDTGAVSKGNKLEKMMEVLSALEKTV